MVTNVFNIGDNSTLHLHDVESLTSGVVGGRTLVFAAGRDDDGISVFELNDDGSLTNLFNLDDTASLGIGSLREIKFVESGGNAFLLAGGDEDELDVFSVFDNGSLSLVDSANTSSNVLMENIDALATIEVGGTTYILTGNAVSNGSGTGAPEGVSIYELHSDGSITLKDTASDNDVLQLNDVRAMVTGEAGGNAFVVAAGYKDDGLSVFQIDASGNLTNTYNLSDNSTLKLNGVRAMASTEVGGKTFIYAGGAWDKGISVFELKSDGTLENVDNYSDGGVHNLVKIRSLETVTTPGGATFLFVVGDGIDGLQIYEVDGEGRLDFYDFVPDDTSQYLDNAEDITTSIIDGKLHVMAGGDEHGVSVYTIPCFAAGTHIATPAGPRRVETLQPGDLVLTRDAGPQPVRFVALRRLSAAELAAAPQFRPVRIARDSFGPGIPSRDLLVSPQHRILLSGPALMLNFGLEEALAPAIALAGDGPVRQQDAGEGITYVHVGFDRHHVVMSEGLASESFLPGPQALQGLEEATLSEVLQLFPDLATGSFTGLRPARPLLRSFEASILAPAPIDRGAAQQTRRA